MPRWRRGEKGALELAWMAESADGAHHVEIGVEKTGVDARGDWVEEAGLRIERALEDGAVEVFEATRCWAQH